MASLPFVTVLVAVRNEERHMSSCLTHICAQDYPKDLFEVLVVDGMSPDRTADIVRSFPSGGVSVRLLCIREQGRAQGLNRGIAAAHGEVILRVDARTVIDRTYLAKCVETLMQTGADNVGGVRKPIPGSATQNAIGLALSHPFGIGSTHARLGGRSGYVDSVYLGCFRKDILEKVGAFDEQAAVINEDWDLNYRIRAAGGKVYLNADITAYYQPRDSLAGLCRLYFRYGGARVGSLLKHRDLASYRYAAAPALVVLLVFCPALFLIDSQLGWAAVAILGLYLLVDAVVAAMLSARMRRFSFFPTLLVAFPCMHLSWGLGFWKRLIVWPRPGTYWAG